MTTRDRKLDMNIGGPSVEIKRTLQRTCTTVCVYILAAMGNYLIKQILNIYLGT